MGGGMVDDASTLMPASPRRANRPDDVVVLTIAYHPDVSRVGERAVVGADCEVRGLSVVGPSAEVGDRNMLDHGVRIASGERIAAGALHFS